jgi:hypothetical protein
MLRFYTFCSCRGGNREQHGTHRENLREGLGSGHAGHYTAVFTAPAGALVTLRSHATDATGGSVTETITSAYQVAS